MIKVSGCILVLLAGVLTGMKVRTTLLFQSSEWCCLEAIIIEIMRNNRHSRRIISESLKESTTSMPEYSLIRKFTLECASAIEDGTNKIDEIWRHYINNIKSVLTFSQGLGVRLMQLGIILPVGECDMIETCVQECLEQLRIEMRENEKNSKSKMKVRIALGGFFSICVLLALV